MGLRVSRGLSILISSGGFVCEEIFCSNHKILIKSNIEVEIKLTKHVQER